ncbi:transcriptional activator RfaH [Anaerohalosphaera lusitana]|uniref:Transcriptional activator RfaH n=1 Tax=Anaerohalosphaera lusitana TaxID=1936003 RepID=A0A1U9NN91_9BACT|nr:transcription termination/antitermination NusG family protein [Anaerohalosphaera lusitana]AQT69359.1 transcriptional activator RfaH [Anaerohalosphaera lusitana]
MLKASENPPVVWPEGVGIADFEGTWWVAHTKSRNEKALAWQMLKKEIQYFLPMAKKVTKRRGRTIRSFLPLFTGYIFFCGDESDRIEVLKTNRVANLIPVKDQDELVSDLEPIERVIREGQDIRPHNYVKAGQKCRVIAGPLMGTEGIAVTSGEGMRLVLQVDMLGQATSVEVASDLIETVE